jgi:hypothetical protein
MIEFVAAAAAILVIAILSFSKFGRSESWNAAVTPLALIIGSNFLICGPLLANEFGSAAALAIAALLALAYAIGAVVRFNIIHVENHARTLPLNDAMAWTMWAGFVAVGLVCVIATLAVAPAGG